MSASISVKRAGPMISLQDLGRPGYIGLGLSVGGALDRLALFEATALLGLPALGATIEMVGMGGTFTTDVPMRFALTGAPMVAQVDGTPIAWNATHALFAGQVLVIGGTISGSVGYLSFAGRMQEQGWLGSTAAHFTAGFGACLTAGDALTLMPDLNPGRPPHHLDVADRFAGGRIRLMPGPQTDAFDAATRLRLAQTKFVRSVQSNRQGVRLDHDGQPFSARNAAQLVSDFIATGDVQMTGDGQPYVLLAESQTVGGYPRIGTVIAADLPRMAQAPLGSPISFEWLTVDEADRLYQPESAILDTLRRTVRPLRRKPADIHDLLSYQLISGVTCGDDLEAVE